jgi:hypothetical protein
MSDNVPREQKQGDEVRQDAASEVTVTRELIDAAIRRGRKSATELDEKIKGRFDRSNASASLRLR